MVRASAAAEKAGVRTVSVVASGFLRQAGAIAKAMGLAGAREAQGLVRAAHARLRDRFRGSWPELFGA